MPITNFTRQTWRQIWLTRQTWPNRRTRQAIGEFGELGELGEFDQFGEFGELSEFNGPPPRSQVEPVEEKLSRGAKMKLATLSLRSAI